MQNDDRAMIDREAPEASLQLIAVGTVTGPVANGGFHPDALNGTLVAPSPHVLVGSRPHEDPIEPAVEPLDVAQLWQLAPAADECLLDRVLGKVRVPKDEPGNCVEAVDLASGESPEGFSIPALRSFDEVPPYVGLPCSRRSFDRLLTL